MISLENVRVEFDGEPLFDHISFLIQPKDKIGLVGNNGAGKTTLLKVILGDIKPEKGHVNLPSDIKIGYLPQQMKLTEDDCMYDSVYKSLENITYYKNLIDDINEKISKRSDYESDEYLLLLNRLSEANEHYHILGGDTVGAEIEKTLLGLGFDSTDMKRNLTEFSGGWRMRVELAKILLNKPDILLLDEPTNHLDIEAIQWFEHYLKNFTGSVILISHDRAFLDNITTRTLELSLGRIYDYKFNYSRFVEEKKKRMEHQQAAYENQQKKIKETEEFIERFRYKADKASLVQSRIKQLEKLNEVAIEQSDTSTIKVKFPEGERVGREVVKCSGLSVAYDENLVLDNVDFLLERGERVAFVGRNGEGKTTFAKAIVGEKDYQGELKLGHNVTLGYYAQNQNEHLTEYKTVLETLEEKASWEMRKEVRSILGAFLFQGEDVEKKVQVLSGGERSRLALATLLLEPHNLLILDEPTNHLDMRSKEVLKNALHNFNGALIVVSHDRDFLDGLVDKVYEFRNKNVKEHLGGIYDFIKKRNIEQLDDLHELKQGIRAGNNKKKQGKEDYEARKEHNRKLNKVEKNISSIEKNIEDYEKNLEQLKREMENPEGQKDYDVYNKYAELKEKYEKEMERWEQLQLELAELKEQQD
ncbi:MAG: ABC-F family ATP-binding cassette domain-containing protein [Bacteroidales bacterium]